MTITRQDMKNCIFINFNDINSALNYTNTIRIQVPHISYGILKCDWNVSGNTY